MIIPQAEPNGEKDALQVAFDAIKAYELVFDDPQRYKLAVLWTGLAIAIELRHLRSNAGVLADIADGTALIMESIEELMKAVAKP